MRVVNDSDYPFEYKSEDAAGLDLHASIAFMDGVELSPGGSTLVNTGITVELPAGCCALILPRSGLTVKHRVLATTGVIDEDYRGELAVNLINLGTEPYTVKPGDRIAQLVIIPILQPEIVDSHKWELSATVRGSDGFGSTGR